MTRVNITPLKLCISEENRLPRELDSSFLHTSIEWIYSLYIHQRATSERIYINMIIYEYLKKLSVKIL